jgi:DNA modification methylase
MYSSSEIRHIPVSELRPRPNNARTHSLKQIRKIARSLRKFGFISPVIVDEQGFIVAGHGRVEGAKMAGLEKVPVITVAHLSSEEVRAYVIADNQLATLAGWDRELLSIEIAELMEAAPELDLTVTGFDLEELELLNDAAPDEAEDLSPPAPAAVDAAVRVGDVWQIGQHRLLCGDALQASSYHALLGSERADVVITDPPYNVPVEGHVCGLGAVKHREFEQASGEMSREEFRRFLFETCANLARFSRPGSLHFIFMDWRSIADLINAGEQVYDDLLNIIVWVKPNGGMGSLYRSRHELVALFKKGRRPHVNRVELGSNGRYRTNVWEYPGANSFGAARDDLKLHPTVKNARMIADAIKDVSDRGDIILDPFAGSGTSLFAAEKCARISRLIELDPLYCDLIVGRAQAGGLEPFLQSSGETLAAVALRRSGERPEAHSTRAEGSR